MFPHKYQVVNPPPTYMIYLHHISVIFSIFYFYIQLFTIRKCVMEPFQSTMVLTIYHGTHNIPWYIHNIPWYIHNVPSYTHNVTFTVYHGTFTLYHGTFTMYHGTIWYKIAEYKNSCILFYRS